MRVPLKIAMLAALLVVVSASSSWALIEQFLPGGASITMKFSNWDEATLYNPLAITPDVLYTRLGQPGYNSAYDLGTLRADPLTGLPTNGYNNEDSWGIMRLKEITGPKDAVLWSNQWTTGDARLLGNAAFELSLMFTGLKDQSLFLDSSTGTQSIKGTGLQFAFFEDTSPINPLDETLGPAARTGLTSYPTVTDGTLIWTGKSVVGDPLAKPYEFLSQFNPGVLTDPSDDVGKGEFFAQAAANVFGLGSQQGLLADLGGNIEFKFQFTADTIDAAPWDLKSQDPVSAKITPELSTTWLMLLGMVPVGMAWRRRKRS